MRAYSGSLVSVAGGRGSTLTGIRARTLGAAVSGARDVTLQNGLARSTVVRTFVTVGPNGEKLTQGLKANGLYDPANEHGALRCLVLCVERADWRTE